MSAVERIGACGQVTPNENRPLVDFGLPEKGLGYAGKIADFVGHFKFQREIRAGRAVNTGPEPGRGSAGSDAGGSRSSCPTSRAAHDLFVAAAPDIRVTGCCASAAPLDQLRMFPPLLRVAGLRCGPWLGVVGVVDAACHHPPRLAFTFEFPPFVPARCALLFPLVLDLQQPGDPAPQLRPDVSAPVPPAFAMCGRRCIPPAWRLRSRKGKSLSHTAGRSAARL
jgi:hypothetical protein